MRALSPSQWRLRKRVNACTFPGGSVSGWVSSAARQHTQIQGFIVDDLRVGLLGPGSDEGDKRETGLMGWDPSVSMASDFGLDAPRRVNLMPTSHPSSPSTLALRDTSPPTNQPHPH